MDDSRLPRNVLEDRLRKLSIAWYDIVCAAAAFEFLIEHPAYGNLLSSERQALVDAAVIAYCRPFDGSARLPPEWPGYTRPHWQEEHAALVDFRHSFVGHSDLDPRTVTVTSTAEPPGWSSRLNLPVFMPGRAGTRDVPRPHPAAS
jgi:hypothetical protein